MNLNSLCWILSNIRQDIKEILFTALILVGLIALIYVFLKFEQTRIWIGCLIVFVMFCTSIISGYKIYQYCTASGETIGDVVSGIFGGNSNAEKVGEYSFKFKNLIFKSTGNENEYRVTYQDIYSNETGLFDLDMTKNWNIYVNNNVTNNNIIGPNYLFGDYSYTFYNDNLKEVFTDTLKVKFVFYNNYYQIDLITNNGETATEFWQSYFSKEDFIVSLKINDYVKDEETKVDTLYFSLSLSFSCFNDIDSFEDFLKSGFDIKIGYKNKNELTYQTFKTFNINTIHYRIGKINPSDSQEKYYVMFYIKINSLGSYYYELSNFNSAYVFSNNLSFNFNLNLNGENMVKNIS